MKGVLYLSYYTNRKVTKLPSMIDMSINSFKAQIKRMVYISFLVVSFHATEQLGDSNAKGNVLARMVLIVIQSRVNAHV